MDWHHAVFLRAVATVRDTTFNTTTFGIAGIPPASTNTKENPK